MDGILVDFRVAEASNFINIHTILVYYVEEMEGSGGLEIKCTAELSDGETAIRCVARINESLQPFRAVERLSYNSCALARSCLPLVDSSASET